MALLAFEHPFKTSATVGSLWGLCTLVAVATPFVAVLTDGRPATGAWLVGSAGISLTLVLLLAPQTERWRHDDGLGQAFTLMILILAGGAYLIAVAVLFGLRYLARRRPE